MSSYNHIINKSTYILMRKETDKNNYHFLNGTWISEGSQLPN